MQDAAPREVESRRSLMLSDVVDRFAGRYVAAYGKRMPECHKVALRSISVCRTPAAGGYVVQCHECGTQGYVWQSCRNRACTRCTRSKGEEWLSERREELLPVSYNHIVFTIPEELRRLVRSRQQLLYGVLMTAVAETLQSFGRQEFGGQLGIMAVLHTWTRALEYHPHVHCLVPSGYVDKQGEWHGVERPSLFSNKALASVFRAKFCAGIRGAAKGLQAPGSVYHKDWVVHVDQPVEGIERVLQYLARYVHRGPMSDGRLVSMNQKTVTFKYKDKERRKDLEMTLKGREFLRRVLQHVLPRGFHRVRYYGFWSKAHRPRLKAIRAQLLASQAPVETRSPSKPEVVRRECQCRLCNSKNLGIVSFFSRGAAPPALRLLVTEPLALEIDSGRPLDINRFAALWVKPALEHPRPQGQSP